MIVCKDLKLQPGENYDESGVVVGFDDIIYVFNKRVTQCLDVVNRKCYQYIYHRQLPRSIRCSEVKWEKSFISTGGRYCYVYQDYVKRTNIRIDLFEVAPKELQEIIKKRVRFKYNKLTFGFIRRGENDYNCIFPDYLKKYVLKYYGLEMEF